MQPVKLHWFHPLPCGLLAAIFLRADDRITRADTALAGTIISGDAPGKKWAI